MWGCGPATAPGGAARPLASSRAAQAVLARPAVSAPGTAEFVFVWEITAPRPPPLCPSPRRPTRRTRRAPGSADVAEAVAKAGTGPNASLRPTRPDGLPGPGRWHRAGGRVGTAERPCPALAVRPWPGPCFAARGGTEPRGTSGAQVKAAEPTRVPAGWGAGGNSHLFLHLRSNLGVPGRCSFIAPL